MGNKYQGQQDDRVYAGEQIDITYNLKRCIHAAECVKRAAAVFDVEKRPWIQPDNDAAANILPVIADCPSGALHYRRKDGGADEAAPETNTITIHEGSYYQFQGDLRIAGAEVDIQDETRATLCRCGESKNKPFCDNSHRELAFESAWKRNAGETAVNGDGPLQITAHENGPLEISGSFTIQAVDGEPIFHAEEKTVWLCRCGQSKSKPFCDGTHNQTGFTAP